MDQDIISVNFTAEDFITSETVRVVLKLAYRPTSEDVDVSEDVKSSLKKVLDTNWFFKYFSKSKDSSGMDFYDILVEGRVFHSDLMVLENHLENVNRRGMKITVSEYSHTPTPAEYSALYSSMRENLYNMIKEELEQINDLLDDDHEYKWRVGNVTFQISSTPPASGRQQMMTESVSPFEIARTYSGNSSKNVQICGSIDGSAMNPPPTETDNKSSACGGFPVTSRVVMAATASYHRLAYEPVYE